MVNEQLSNDRLNLSNRWLVSYLRPTKLVVFTLLHIDITFVTVTTAPPRVKKLLLPVSALLDKSSVKGRSVTEVEIPPLGASEELGNR